MPVDPLLEPQRRAMGMRLREAREARDINPRALETELRTTYRHLLAIEEGQTRLFYSDSFYRDLFTRYALCLGFSAQEAEVMVERLYEPIPPLGQAPATGTALGAITIPPEGSADPSPTTAPQDMVAASKVPSTDAPEAARTDSPGSAPTSPVATEAPSSGQASLSLDLPAAPRPPAVPRPPAAQDALQAPTPKAPARPSNTGLFVIILVGLIAFVWVITRAPDPEASTPLADPASQSQAAPGPAVPADNAASDTSAPSVPPPTPPASVGPTPAAAPAVAPTPRAAPQAPAPVAAPLAKPAALPSAPGPTSAPAQAPTPPAAPPPPAAPSTPPAPGPAVPTAPAAPPSVPAAPAPEGAAPKVPELELTFRTKGWVWVRESNDQVREFVVQEGGTVRFQEVPIFIVLPAPDQIDAKVFGRPVSLKRTEDEKNHGRFTRTMLRQAANLGRPTTANNN